MESINNILEGLFKGLQTPEKLRNKNITQAWPEIVGPKIAEHTKVVLGKEKNLNVWVDQSTLAFELRQRYYQAILKRVQSCIGADVVKTLRFYVGQIR